MPGSAGQSSHAHSLCHAGTGSQGSVSFDRAPPRFKVRTGPGERAASQPNPWNISLHRSPFLPPPRPSVPIGASCCRIIPCFRGQSCTDVRLASFLLKTGHEDLEEHRQASGRRAFRHSGTKEIEGLIKQSSRSVASGVRIAEAAREAMRAIIAGAEKSSHMVAALASDIDQQVEAFREVARATETISEMSMSITAATEEQTTNARQVAMAIENVNELTQQAATGAEEMSAATEELSIPVNKLHARGFLSIGCAPCPGPPERGPDANHAGPVGMRRAMASRRSAIR